jgi:predicted ATPase
VTRRPIKIGITGTHSTGKSTFIAAIRAGLERDHLKIASIDDLAQRARELGFPILSEHTFESTLWIMAECMRQEAEASLSADVVLVDRPVPDALGYLRAALEVTGRKIDERRVDELGAIARAHAGDYDLLVVSVLDPSVRLGEGRDEDAKFREAAARHISALMADFAPDALQITTTNSEQIIVAALEFVRKAHELE